MTRRQANLPIARRLDAPYFLATLQTWPPAEWEISFVIWPSIRWSIASSLRLVESRKTSWNAWAPSIWLSSTWMISKTDSTGIVELETCLFPMTITSSLKVSCCLFLLKWPNNKKRIISGGLLASSSIVLVRRSTTNKVSTTGATRTIFLSFAQPWLMEPSEIVFLLTHSKTISTWT